MFRQTDVLGTVTGELEPETQSSEPISDNLVFTINKIFSMSLQKDHQAKFLPSPK